MGLLSDGGLGVGVVLVTIFLRHLQALPLDNSPTIIGGNEAAPGEFPWMVSIQGFVIDKYTHLCGGTIISPNLIITGAHCIEFWPRMSELIVVAGAHNITLPEASQQRVNITRMVKHAGYDFGYILNDIALLEVRPPFVETWRVKSLQLPPNNVEVQGNCSIAGWGRTLNAQSSDVLIKAIVPVQHENICSVVYSNFQPKSQICAGWPQGGIDACIGDSGGALVCTNLGYNYFGGVGSYGEYCARPGYPGVYTDIPFYVEWIYNLWT